MTQTRWTVDGPDGTSLELDGRKFSSNDEGAPMMCNLVCSSMGRHVHIDYCRAEQGGRCDGGEIQHIHKRMTPNPDKPKDFITHGLSWRRMGALAIPLLRQHANLLPLGFKGHEHMPSTQASTDICDQTHTPTMSGRVL